MIYEIGLFLFCFFRLKVLMLFFQQEEYDNRRFVKDIFRRATLIDKKLVPLVLGLGLLFFFGLNDAIVNGGILLLFAVFALSERKMLQKAKKKMVMTRRVKMTIGVTLGLALCLMGISREDPFFFQTALVVEFLPFLLMGANFLLKPVRLWSEKRYLTSAKRKLSAVKPIIIGITGSYGKTSVKHILGHLLSTFEPTLFPKGSINTRLGISSVINRSLTPDIRYFVSEMGAYQKGSITRLCDLTPPTHGIVTAIGMAHYERFKSEQNVAEAKFELADFVEKAGGKLVVNLAQIKSEYIPNKKMIVPVGENGKYTYSDVIQDKDGISFSFSEQGKEPVSCHVHLYGRHHAGNVALALAMMRELGFPISTLQASLVSLPQIAHRLEVKPQGNVTWIDDAYNSNPTGFKSALEVLALLDGKRKILVTPGMVELGARHDEAHLEIGRLAGEKADVVLAVCADRIPTFVKGVKEGKKAEVVTVSSFAEALKWLEARQQTGDVILLENDLPDLYESRWSL